MVVQTALQQWATGGAAAASGARETSYLQLHAMHYCCWLVMRILNQQMQSFLANLASFALKTQFCTMDMAYCVCLY